MCSLIFQFVSFFKTKNFYILSMDSFYSTPSNYYYVWEPYWESSKQQWLHISILVQWWSQQMNCIFLPKAYSIVSEMLIYRSNWNFVHIVAICLIVANENERWVVNTTYARSYCVAVNVNEHLTGRINKDRQIIASKTTKRRVSHRVTGNRLYQEQQQQQQQPQRIQNICLHRCGKANNYENAFTSHRLWNSFTDHRNDLQKIWIFHRFV